MIDEGARLLSEGIARNTDDIDAVWLHGFGWPKATGGPMFHARTVGMDGSVTAFKPWAIPSLPHCAAFAPDPCSTDNDHEPSFYL
jgi:3-hydroxyacyl-CoA dehydrogenase